MKPPLEFRRPLGAVGAGTLPSPTSIDHVVAEMDAQDERVLAEGHEQSINVAYGHTWPGGRTVTLCTLRDPSAEELVAIARDVERNGDAPILRFVRDLHNHISGVALDGCIAGFRDLA